MPINNLRDVADTFRIARGLPRNPNHHSILASALINAQGEVCAYVDNSGQLVDARGIPIAAINARSLKEDFVSLDTTDQVTVILPSGLTPSGATDVLHHLYSPAGNKFGLIPLGAGQTIIPGIVANGLDLEGDQTDNEGYELFAGFAGADGRPFIIGKDPAFYMRAKLLLSDVSVIDTFLVGFRRAAVNQGAYTSYADYAALGWNTSAAAALIKTLTGLNGTDAATTTTDTIADAVALQIEVNVSAAGVVTYRHDAVAAGTLAAPTATTAFTFDNGDPVIPFIHFLHGSSAACSVVLQNLEFGYQRSALRP